MDECSNAVTSDSDTRLKSTRVRKRILDSAGTMFARLGIGKTTLNDIARSLNMTKSSMYYYFKNKEDMFQAVIEQESVIFLKEIREAINKIKSPKDKLFAFGDTHMRNFRKVANINQAVKLEYLENYTFVQRLRKNHDAKETLLFIDILDEGVEKGEFSIHDTKLVAEAFVMGLKGLEYEWMLNEKHLEPKKLEILFNLLLKGIQKR